MTTKQLNIKNRSYYFYNNLINLKVDKKSWKDFDIYYLGYVDKKPEWHVNSVNQLYFIVNRTYGIISEENGTKYLTIDKPESVLKKYKEVFTEIKQKIQKNNGEKVIFNDDYQKMKFLTDDTLPLNELIYFSTMTVIIRCIFKHEGLFHPQIYLDDALYQTTT